MNDWLLGLRVATSDLIEAIASYLDAQVEILHQPSIAIGDTVYVVSGGAPTTSTPYGGNPQFENSQKMLVMGRIIRATSQTIRVQNFNETGA